jgi:hypothetical protein
MYNSAQGAFTFTVIQSMAPLRPPPWGITGMSYWVDHDPGAGVQAGAGLPGRVFSGGRR